MSSFDNKSLDEQLKEKLAKALIEDIEEIVSPTRKSRLMKRPWMS